jgi:hypothetical protein
MRRHRLAAGAVVVLFGLLGWLAADQAGAVLAISFREKPLQAEEQVALAAEPGAGSPLDPVEAIVLPQGGPAEALLQTGAADLAAALQLRTGLRPAVLVDGAAPKAGRVVRVGVGSEERGARGEGAAGAAREESGNDEVGNRESFRLRGIGRDLAITGATPLAAVYGMAHLADRLVAGAGDAQLARLDTVVTPALRHRFVDLGGVGILPDTAAWRVGDYSHHNRAFQHIIRPDSPFIDPAALAHTQEQFRAYARRMAAYGYNGIVVPGFLQFVNFDGVGSGFEVYAADSPYRRRHLALREAYGPMFRYARALGLAVVLNTDMLALTAPLERHFETRLGGIDAADPAVWEVYRRGMAELFEAFPEVSGVMIRVGEAGTVYNLEGWNYYSELHVRTDDAVRAMLRAFDAVAAEHGRSIFFRTWTVGVGGIGDLHTSLATYERVLGGLALPRTVFSTKFVTGDFYSYLPVNPTLFTGDQPRLVELQARREFEGFASFPNYLGPLHGQMLRQVREGNPHVEGIWLWTQEGGPLRAGPMSLYPFHGFWHLVDADVYAAGRLGWDPDADVAALTRSWVRRTFGPDPAAVEALTEVLLRSRRPVLGGLYIGEFARRDVRALGLEPPPMLWIFEWDIVTGSSAVLSAIHHTSRGDLEGAITEGFAAVADVRRLRELAESVGRGAVIQPAVLDRLIESLAYQESLLKTLAWYRQAVLSHYGWLSTGSRGAQDVWRTARAEFELAKDLHLARYADDVNFRAWSFFDAEVGLAHADRGPAMAWSARLLLLLALAALLAGSAPAQRRLPQAGSGGLRMLWLSVADPWRLHPAPLRSGSDLLVAVLVPLALVVLAHLAFSSFLSPSYALVVGLVITCWFAALLHPNRARAPLPLLAALAGPLLPAACLLLAVLAVRGPLWLWYGFWIRDRFRTLLLVGAAVAFGWLLVCTYYALRRVAGRSVRQAVGQLLTALGVPLLALGVLLHAVGLERAITRLNDELALLPMGLSRILGITTHLNIPLGLPLQILGLGAALGGIGLLLALAAPPHRTADLPRGGSSGGAEERGATASERPTPGVAA